jgi:hypothetical protein
MTGASKYPTQLVDDARRELTELGKLWRDRFTLDNRRLAKGYRNNNIRLLFFIRIATAEQFVAIFERKPIIGFGDIKERTYPPDRRVVAGGGLDQELILVRNVEIVMAHRASWSPLSYGWSPSRTSINGRGAPFTFPSTRDLYSWTVGTLGSRQIGNAVSPVKVPFMLTAAQARWSRAERRLWITSPVVRGMHGGIDFATAPGQFAPSLGAICRDQPKLDGPDAAIKGFRKSFRQSLLVTR